MQSFSSVNNWFSGVRMWQEPVTQRNCLRNAIVKQVSESIACVTPHFCNLQQKNREASCIKKLNNLLLFATLRRQLERVTCPLQPALQRTVAITAQVGEIIAFWRPFSISKIKIHKMMRNDTENPPQTIHGTKRQVCSHETFTSCNNGGRVNHNITDQNIIPIKSHLFLFCEKTLAYRRQRMSCFASCECLKSTSNLQCFVIVSIALQVVEKVASCNRVFNRKPSLPATYWSEKKSLNKSRLNESINIVYFPPMFLMQ